MQETLSIIILVLAFIDTASALVAGLILGNGKNRQSYDKARIILMVTLGFEFLLGTWKVIQSISNPGLIMEFKILNFPGAVILLCLQSWLFAYPMSILRPVSIHWKTFALMTAPYLLIALLYEFLPFEHIALEEPQDIIRFIKEPDVLYRISTLAFFLPFSVMLPFLHIRTKEVSVNTIGIFVYTLSIITLSLLLSFYILTGFPYFLILYLIIGFCNNAYLIYYEQFIRGSADASLNKKLNDDKVREGGTAEEKTAELTEKKAAEEGIERSAETVGESSSAKESSVVKESSEMKVEANSAARVEADSAARVEPDSAARVEANSAVRVEERSAVQGKESIAEPEYEEMGMTSIINQKGNFKTKDELTSMDLVHEQLCEAFNIKNIWKRSDLTIDILAKEIGTNKTYIQKCIKAATGYNYTEFVNRERVNFIKKTFMENPERDLKQVLSEAGYSSRTTAWRNFKKITGVTPTDYIKEMKNS